MPKLSKQGQKLKAYAITINPKLKEWLKDERVNSFLNALYELLAEQKRQKTTNN